MFSLKIRIVKNKIHFQKKTTFLKKKSTTCKITIDNKIMKHTFKHSLTSLKQLFNRRIIMEILKQLGLQMLYNWQF